MAAILENDPSALQEALQSGVRLDVTDSHGHTPLDMALAHGNAFSAPGRVELCGNHTDHQGGRVLAAAIDRAECKLPKEEMSALAVRLSEGVASPD